MNQIHIRLDRQRQIFERRLAVQVNTWLKSAANLITKAVHNRFSKADESKFVDWSKIEEIGIGYVKPIIFDAFSQAGKSAYGIVGLTGAFDVYTVEAMEIVNKICSKLVKNITNETKKALNSRISAAIEEGMNLRQIMGELTSIIGLSDKQTRTLVSFERWLAKEYPNMSTSEMSRKLDQYKSKLINDRVSTIARTETARAQNYGYVEAMGSIGVTEYEFSIYPGACEEYCIPLNGNKFEAGEAEEIIPVHPNCRCILLPVINHKTLETPVRHFPESLTQPGEET